MQINKEPHENPITKIRKKKNMQLLRKRASASKENLQNGLNQILVNSCQSTNSKTKSQLVKKVSINLGGDTTKRLSKFVNVESISILNKSISGSQLLLQKQRQQRIINRLKQVNQSIKSQIDTVDGKIKQLSERKGILELKYKSLMQKQELKLKRRILTVSGNHSQRTPISSKINQSESILQLSIHQNQMHRYNNSQNSQGRQHIKAESRMKMSQLKQKIQQIEVDLTSMAKEGKKFKKECGSKTTRT